MENIKNIMKVRQLEHLNQFVIENDKQTIFQSYSSIIAVYDKENDVLTLGCDWDYSTTTSKHLYIFLDEVFRYSWSNLKEDILSALKTTNKRKAIQKLIDLNIIQYESKLI